MLGPADMGDRSRMQSSEESPARRQILIAGGGFAAVEALLALRALLGDRAEVTLVAPGDRFAFRPAAPLEACSLAPSPPQSYSLAEIAAHAGATLRRDRLESVASATKKVRLASGSSLGYDSLILALGTRAQVAVPGALTFRDQRDVPQMRALLEELRAERVSRIVFAVPSGCTWPLPLYELAMLSAAFAQRFDVEAQICVVSPASAPLEMFGKESSRMVETLLDESGVRFIGSSAPASVRRDGALQLHFGGAVQADRVVAAPQLRGPRIAGVPSRWWGFVSVDAEGRVEGLSDVYAAGDMTSFPVKQGGLAAAQADVIARVIAAEEGLPVAIPPAPDPGRMMRARLLGGARSLALRARLDVNGAPHDVAGESHIVPLRRPGAVYEKVDARHLGAYLAERAAAVAEAAQDA